MPGQYALRGGILDVYPPEAPRPVRVELLGDTVESLREFDPESQRSTAPVGRVALSSLTEFAVSEATPDGDASAVAVAAPSATTLFDLREDMLVILDEPERIESAAAEARERLSQPDSATMKPPARPPPPAIWQWSTNKPGKRRYTAASNSRSNNFRFVATAPSRRPSPCSLLRAITDRLARS